MLFGKINLLVNNMNSEHETILEGLRQFYKAGMQTPEASLLDHLSNDVSLRSYLNKGLEMAERLPKGAHVLDWGAGFGQMTYILTKLGFVVTPYDVIQRQHNLFAESGTELIFGTEEKKIPFRDTEFDGALSCGVLEHVPNIPGSIAEIFRVLKPGGTFFIYNLPYILSPSEFYAAYRKISVHPIRFTKSGTAQLLEEAGFTVPEVGHENGIPKRLSGPLKIFRPFSNAFPGLFLALDRLITTIPLVRSLISNSTKFVAVKPR
jgi:SAM-dependent methyltransferase